jgi:hypothetical protein
MSIACPDSRPKSSFAIYAIFGSPSVLLRTQVVADAPLPLEVGRRRMVHPARRGPALESISHCACVRIRTDFPFRMSYEEPLLPLRSIRGPNQRPRPLADSKIGTVKPTYRKVESTDSQFLRMAFLGNNLRCTGRDWEVWPWYERFRLCVGKKGCLRRRAHGSRLVDPVTHIMRNHFVLADNPYVGCTFRRCLHPHFSDIAEEKDNVRVP